MCGQAGWPNHVMWATLNITWKPSRSYAQEMDSGMVLVDTKKHWGPLALTYRLASDSFVQKVSNVTRVFIFAYLILSSKRYFMVIKIAFDSRGLRMGVNSCMGPFQPKQYGHHLDNTFFIPGRARPHLFINTSQMFLIAME